MKNHTENILVLTQWSFKDALVQVATLPYLDIMRRLLPLSHKIILVTSEQARMALSPAELQKVNAAWAGKNMHLVAQPYKPMGAKKILAGATDMYRLYRLIRKEKIGIIHCFCTPAGAIGYVLSRLTGARLVIDSYEPHAEAMVENGTWQKSGLAFRFLFLLEKLQSRRAAFVLSAATGMENYAKEKYGLKLQNCFVRPVCVNPEQFNAVKKDLVLLKELGLESKIVCVYAGKLGGIYLKKEVFDFVRECYRHWGERFRFLMLTNATREEVEGEMKRVGLPENIVIQKFLPHTEVPRYLALGNFGLNPVNPVPTKRFCTSLKDGEYWAMGLPVVITKNISDDSAIITRHDIGYELQRLDIAEYQNAIRKMETLMEDPEIEKRVKAVAKQYRNFAIAGRAYEAIYGATAGLPEEKQDCGDVIPAT